MSTTLQCGSKVERNCEILTRVALAMREYKPSSCVCPSVTRKYCIKTAKLKITQTTPCDSTGTLVFLRQQSLVGVPIYQKICTKSDPSLHLPMWLSCQRTWPPCAIQRDAFSGRGSLSDSLSKKLI